MKKDIILYLVLISCFAGGIFFKYFFHYPFFGGMCSGSSLMLLIFSTIGQRQLNKAGKRMDKLLKDKVVALNSDNDNFENDD